MGIYLGEPTIVKEIFHNQQVHLCDLGFVGSAFLLGLLECQFITTEDFRKERRSLE